MVDSIFSTPIEVMVLILDGKSKIVRTLGAILILILPLISLKHLMWSRAVTN